MLELYNGNLEVEKILSSWYKMAKKNNFGALSTFIGIVRDENEIDGLYFDIYEPLLKNWFASWDEKLKLQNSKIFMAHSIGNVENNKTSFICAIASKHRKIALETLNTFVEDFKANAPIWKYDIKNGKKVYAKQRSKALPNAGLLC